MEKAARCISSNDDVVVASIAPPSEWDIKYDPNVSAIISHHRVTTAIVVDVDVDD